jgi:uncharacterized protein (TIGR03118 family)
LIDPWGIVVAGAENEILSRGNSQLYLFDVQGFDGGGQGILLNPGGDSATGMVNNSTSESCFLLGGDASSLFFAGEDGHVSGWTNVPDADGADPAQFTTLAFSATDGAVYKGLAEASSGSSTFLYATDFRNNKIDVLDCNFHVVSGGTSFPFKDPSLPTGYAPFGIAALSIGNQTQILVTYAQQIAGSIQETDGAGLGLVDVYDPAGNLLKTLIPAGGVLNAPWALVLAPTGFGPASGKLLIGNFGDGRLNVFDPVSGALLGTLADVNIMAISIAGLRGVAFQGSALFFAAGTTQQYAGLYGRIDAGSSPPSSNPVATLTSPAAGSVVSGTIQLNVYVANDIDVPGSSVIVTANGTTIVNGTYFGGNPPVGSTGGSDYAPFWDSTQTPNGPVSLVATVADPAGRTSTSPPITVTVNNPSAATAAYAPPRPPSP